MSAPNVEVTVSNRTIIRVLLLLAGAFLLFNFARNTAHVLQLIFLAAFLSLALSPAINWIVRRLHLKSRIAGTALAYLLVLAILIFFTIVVIVPLVRQTVDFVIEAPRTVQDLKTNTGYVGNFIREHQLEDEVDGLSHNIRERTRNIQQPLIENAGRVGSALIALITLFVLVFMMIVEGPRWVEKYWQLHPAKHKERYRKLANRMYTIVTGYVIGQVLLALLAAAVVLVSLLISSTLLDVSINAVALAGMVFVTGLIPMIGHIIGGTIIVLACSFVSIPLAIIMACVMIIHQQIENITLQPYIQSKYNELTPLTVFIAALLGIGFGGILGAFIAIPLVGCLKILLVDYLEHRKTVS